MPNQFNLHSRGDYDAQGLCPHCNLQSRFERVFLSSRDEGEDHRAYRCAGCEGLVVYEWESEQLHPGNLPRDLPNLPSGDENAAEGVEELYEEGLRCISVNAPNGALTCFRKTIHALAIHYDIVSEDEDAKFWELIDALNDEGHITDRLHNGLTEVRQVGADGAHVNPNNPDMSQARAIKDVLESVLRSTIVVDADISRAQNLRDGSNRGE